MRQTKESRFLPWPQTRWGSRSSLQRLGHEARVALEPGICRVNSIRQERALIQLVVHIPSGDNQCLENSLLLRCSVQLF